MPGRSGVAVITRPSGGFAAVAAQAVDLGAQRGEPVGLVAAQVGDAGAGRPTRGWPAPRAPPLTG